MRSMKHDHKAFQTCTSRGKLFSNSDAYLSYAKILVGANLIISVPISTVNKTFDVFTICQFLVSTELFT